MQITSVDNIARLSSPRADEAMFNSRKEAGYAQDHMHAGSCGHKMVAEKIVKELTWL